MRRSETVPTRPDVSTEVIQSTESVGGGIPGAKTGYIIRDYPER